MIGSGCLSPISPRASKPMQCFGPGACPQSHRERRNRCKGLVRVPVPNLTISIAEDAWIWSGCLSPKQPPNSWRSRAGDGNRHGKGCNDLVWVPVPNLTTNIETGAMIWSRCLSPISPRASKPMQRFGPGACPQSHESHTPFAKPALE